MGGGCSPQREYEGIDATLDLLLRQCHPGDGEPLLTDLGVNRADLVREKVEHLIGQLGQQVLWKCTQGLDRPVEP